jgi:hypothetical protein
MSASAPPAAQAAGEDPPNDTPGRGCRTGNPSLTTGPLGVISWAASPAVRP